MATRTYTVCIPVSGTRNGVDWPRPGEQIVLPEREAADYIAAGIVIDPEGAAVETATRPGSEKATRPRGRGSAKAQVEKTT